jgi:CubicO group peptidase (beta-lactamase class C family)
MAVGDEFDGLIEGVRSDWAVPGLAVSVVRGDEAIYARGFGQRHLGETGVVDSKTLFQIGSTTKAFTTAAIGLLVDEERLSWDDRVIEYLASFRVRDPWVTRNLTIRDAIAHRAGLPHSVYPFLGLMSSDEGIAQLAYAPETGRFRDSFVYNNLMYAVLGKVIESVTTVSWEALVKSRLLGPLDMERSDTTPFGIWERSHVTASYRGHATATDPVGRGCSDPNVAMPHGYAEDGSLIALPWQSYEVAAPAGAIVSCVDDLARWLCLQLNEGRYAGQALLAMPTVYELHRTQNIRAGPAEFPFDGDSGYAMGWATATYRGRRLLWHGGGIIGFPAYVALLPDEKLGVAVLANGPQWPHRALALSIFDSLLDESGPNWSEELRQRSQNAQRQRQETEERLHAARRKEDVRSFPFSAYCGVYEDIEGHSGPVSVSPREGRLILSFAGEGAYCAHLDHWHHELFRLRPVPGLPDVPDRHGIEFASFSIDPRGVVSTMRFLGASFQRVPS